MSPVVTICTASLTFNSSTFCPHRLFMCFVWIWEQTAIISLHKENRNVLCTHSSPMSDRALPFLKVPSSPCSPSNRNRQMKMCLEYRRNGTDRGNPKTLENKPSLMLLFQTNLTRTDLGSNLTLCGQRPATDRLSYGTAISLYGTDRPGVHSTQVCLLCGKDWIFKCISA